MHKPLLCDVPRDAAVIPSEKVMMSPLYTTKWRHDGSYSCAYSCCVMSPIVPGLRECEEANRGARVTPNKQERKGLFAPLLPLPSFACRFFFRHNSVHGLYVRCAACDCILITEDRAVVGQTPPAVSCSGGYSHDPLTKPKRDHSRRLRLHGETRFGRLTGSR